MATILKYNNKIYKHNNKPVKINWNSGDGLYFGNETTPNDYVNCGTGTTNIRFKKSDIFSFSQSFLYRVNPLYNNTTFYNRVFGIGTSNMYVLNVFSVSTGQFIASIQWGLGGPSSSRFVIPTPAENTVCHLVMVNNGLDSRLQKCFFNGIEITNATFAVNLTELLPSGNFTIGLSNGAYSYKCINYDLKIFNKELTQSEVTELFIKQNQIVPASAISSLQADWRFNQRSGTVLKDYSPNGYNGTLRNFANTSLGVNNAWVYNNNQPVTQY